LDIVQLLQLVVQQVHPFLILKPMVGMEKQVVQEQLQAEVTMILM
jgi:hypothetical protein